MWSKISSALKSREGNDSDADHSDTQANSRSPPPDPFRIDATTYYTQQAPPTPPSGVHSRSASREEDIIWSLRTQLALQQEMCAQFEIDLAARDKLVEALTIRLESSEKENDKRKSVIRSWKKKAADLERMCRHLEEEVDSSRQESMERSIMDEASGEALRQLHQQISQLEREKSEVESERDALTQTVEALQQLRSQNLHLEQAKADRASLAQGKKEIEAEVLRLKEEKQHAEMERDNFSSEISRLRAHIQQLQKDSAVMEVTIVQLNKQLDQDKEDINGLNIALESKQQELELVKRKHGARAGQTTGRTNVVPPNTIAAIQPSKVMRTSAATARASSPVLPGVPSALGRATNTRPPLANVLRRVSISSVESKIKPSGRRASIGSMASETDEKENVYKPAPPKHPRRLMVPA